MCYRLNKYKIDKALEAYSASKRKWNPGTAGKIKNMENLFYWVGREMNRLDSPAVYVSEEVVSEALIVSTRQVKTLKSELKDLGILKLVRTPKKKGDVSYWGVDREYLMKKACRYEINKKGNELSLSDIGNLEVKNKYMRNKVASGEIVLPQRVKRSLEEEEVALFVESLGFKVNRNDKELLVWKEVDILLPDIKIAIEYNGDYWHRGKRNIKRELEKRWLVEQQGYKYLCVWESSWEKDRLEMEILLRKALFEDVIDDKLLRLWGEFLTQEEACRKGF